MDEKLSGQLRRLNLERSKSRKPMAAINSSQKSLPCVHESKLIRTRNQVLSFPLLSFFLSFFFFSFKRTLLAYSLSPSETYAHLLSSSFFCDIKPEECGRYIHIYEGRGPCVWQGRRLPYGWDTGRGRRLSRNRAVLASSTRASSFHA